MATPLVRAVGLAELEKTLRTADPELRKRLQQELKKVAEGVASKARARAGPHVSSRSRASIRPQAGGREARIVAGGSGAPEFMGQEFGGGSRPRTRQFPAHTGTRGYFLYPTVREELSKLGPAIEDVIDEVFATRTGPL